MTRFGGRMGSSGSYWTEAVEAESSDEIVHCCALSDLFVLIFRLQFQNIFGFLDFVVHDVFVT